MGGLVGEENVRIGKGKTIKVGGGGWLDWLSVVGGRTTGEEGTRE